MSSDAAAKKAKEETNKPRRTSHSRTTNVIKKELTKAVVQAERSRIAVKQWKVDWKKSHDGRSATLDEVHESPDGEVWRQYLVDKEIVKAITEEITRVERREAKKAEELFQYAAILAQSESTAAAGAGDGSSAMKSSTKESPSPISSSQEVEESNLETNKKTIYKHNPTIQLDEQAEKERQMVEDELLDQAKKNLLRSTNSSRLGGKDTNSPYSPEAMNRTPRLGLKLDIDGVTQNAAANHTVETHESSGNVQSNAIVEALVDESQSSTSLSAPASATITPRLDVPPPPSEEASPVMPVWARDNTGINAVEEPITPRRGLNAHSNVAASVASSSADISPRSQMEDDIREIRARKFAAAVKGREDSSSAGGTPRDK